MIDPITGQCDEVLIRDNFWQVDADRVLKIPLFQHATKDFVAWQLTKNGVFSVRSAYYKQWEEYADTDNDGVSRHSSSFHPVWRKLWKLKVPGKINFFLSGGAYTTMYHANVSYIIVTSGKCHNILYVKLMRKTWHMHYLSVLEHEQLGIH